MTQKDVVHHSDITSRHTNHHNRNILIVMGIALIIGLAVMWVALQPETQSTAISSNVEVLVYNNALEMQYAQPWLDVQSVKITPAVPYSDALAMQYAQPWLNAASVVQYNNALEMQYAQPWLNAQSNANCNGRLDEMYACQNNR